MPTIDWSTLLALLGHPLSIGAGGLLLAAGVGAIVGAQLRAIGLDRSNRGGRLRWSTVFASAAFWAAWLLALQLAASRGQASALASLLSDALGTLLALVPAGLVLAGASHFRAEHIRDAADRRDLDEGLARQQGDIGLAVVGVLVTLGLTSQGLGSFLIAAALCAGGLWLMQSPENRETFGRLVDDLLAGQALRTRGLKPGAELEHEGRRLKLLGVVGPLSCMVLEEGFERSYRNRELLRVVTQAKQIPGGAPPPGP